MCRDREVRMREMTECLTDMFKKHRERKTNVMGEKRVIGRLRGIFMCVCTRSHG